MPASKTSDQSVAAATAAAGLTTAEAKARQAQVGRNELAEGKRLSAARVLFRQFTGLLVVILIIASALAFLLGEVTDGIVIAAVVVLNGVLGFVQEWRAETALIALRGMLAPQAVVVRDGVRRVIDARDIVPGDLVILTEGDRIPADGEVVAETGLRVDESALTGESVPVSRPLGETVLSGTTVTSGHAEVVVTRIGTETEFGQVAQLTGDVDRRPTTLQRQLQVLARQLGGLSIVVAAGVALAGYWKGLEALEVFMLGLSMAVAMVPEGLPAVVTVTLALGAGAMARRQALVRRLQAVETLGAASVICTDKTGTLTENKMTVRRLWTGGRFLDVSGTGYDPAGEITHAGEQVAGDPDVALIARIGRLCSHATLHQTSEGWQMIGDPTEGALLALSLKAGDTGEPAELIDEAPFTSDRKRMSVLVRAQGATSLLMKGAPERVLACCSARQSPEGPVALADQDRLDIAAAAHEMAGEGMRVIALAWRPDANDLSESEMVFVGLTGLIDPPRAEVKAAIASASAAGIRTLMITGDHPATAGSIAREIGIGATRVITGDEIETLSDEALTAALRDEVAFARVAPAHKLRVVSALQAEGETVAMTGDGVNDAPGLRRADIGIAMGQRGTEVARDASDVVLLDDNYATIVRAVAEGRRQFDNIRKFVRYLLSSNAGEVIALLVNIVIGAPLIFLPTQILWMNLVTDGVTAVALGLEPSEPGQMKERPRPRGTRILNLRSAMIIGSFGLYTGLACVWLFSTLLPLGVDIARTGAFTGMVVFEKVSVFAFRSLSAPNWRLGWFGNRPLLVAFSAMMLLQVAAVYWTPLGSLLHTVPLAGDVWLLIAALALPLVVVPEAIKTVLDRRATSA